MRGLTLAFWASLRGGEVHRVPVPFEQCSFPEKHSYAWPCLQNMGKGQLCLFTDEEAEAQSTAGTFGRRPSFCRAGNSEGTLEACPGAVTHSKSWSWVGTRLCPP